MEIILIAAVVVCVVVSLCVALLLVWHIKTPPDSGIWSYIKYLYIHVCSIQTSPTFGPIIFNIYS